MKSKPRYPCRRHTIAIKNRVANRLSWNKTVQNRPECLIHDAQILCIGLKGIMCCRKIDTKIYTKANDSNRHQTKSQPVPTSMRHRLGRQTQAGTSNILDKTVPPVYIT